MKKKCVVLMLLTFFIGAAHAEWVHLGDGDNISVYADPATLRNDGGTQKIWAVWDFVKPEMSNGIPFQSMKTDSQIDCQGQRVRMLSTSGHPQAMGVGAEIWSSDTTSAWGSGVSGGAFGMMWNYVCVRLKG